MLFLLSLILMTTPLSASAGLFDFLLDDTTPVGDSTVPAVPEPSGAILMGLGLTIAAVLRRAR